MKNKRSLYIGATISRDNTLIFIFDRDFEKFLYTDGQYTKREMLKAKKSGVFPTTKKIEQTLYAANANDKQIISSIFNKEY